MDENCLLVIMQVRQISPINHLFVNIITLSEGRNYLSVHLYVYKTNVSLYYIENHATCN